jgi:hypothetical protein
MDVIYYVTKYLLRILFEYVTGVRAEEEGP